MRIRTSASLREVAAEVSAALLSAGVDAVLTGGACATLYTDGAYESFDLDFILRRPSNQRALDEALEALGFRREHDRYVRPGSPFFVEFPSGPLGIGRDLDIRPVPLRIGRARLVALSATDSCRDRLAAWYHWDDRQCLDAAVEIARRHSVNHRRIRAWSLSEGAREKHAEFLRALRWKKSRNLRVRLK